MSRGFDGNRVCEHFIQPALYGVCVRFYTSHHTADSEEQGCGVPHNSAYWIACVRICARCIKYWYPLLDDLVCQFPDAER